MCEVAVQVIYIYIYIVKSLDCLSSEQYPPYEEDDPVLLWALSRVYPSKVKSPTMLIPGV